VSKRYDKERRNFERFTIKESVTFFTINHHNKTPHFGNSQNLSASGIYLITDHALKLGDEIIIVLDQRDTHTDILAAEGKVVRCKFDKKNIDLFHVSIEFSEPHESWDKFIITNTFNAA